MAKFFIYIFLTFIFSLTPANATKTFTLDCGSDMSLRAIGEKIQTKGKKTDFKWEDHSSMHIVTWNSNEIVIGKDPAFEIKGKEYDRQRFSTKKRSSKIKTLFWNSSTYEEIEFSLGYCEIY